MARSQPNMPLETEIQYYESQRADLVKQYNNLYVLIKGSSLVGVFPDAETAHRAGVDKFGMEPFLVKQVLAVDPVNVAPIASLLVSAGL